MSAKTNDTLFLAAGGIIFLGACGWAVLQQAGISSLSAPVSAPSSGSVYEAAPLKLTQTETLQWAGVNHQSSGEKWIFDVFTPPKIYYNLQTKRFTVTPPERIVDITGVTVVKPTVQVGFGLELVTVTQPLFRLQLEGYIGEGPKARGTFVNVKTGELLIAVAGKKIPDLNLVIVSFVAERRKTETDGTPIWETVAFAVVRDTETGVETRLDAKVRTPEGVPEVTFKVLADGTLRTSKSGDVFTVGDSTFTVGELKLLPPTARVTRKDKSQIIPETKDLVVPPPAPPPPPEGTPPVDSEGQPLPTQPNGAPVF